MKTIFAIILISIFVVVSVVFMVMLQVQTDKTEEIKGILNLQNEVETLLDTNTDALVFYDSASISYDEQNYKQTITNCENARELFSKGTQEVRELKVTIKEEGVVYELYRNLLGEKIIMSDSLYEACEYLESASRNYDIYFNTYNSGDSFFDMADAQIDAVNEKIDEHDDAVGRHNDLLAEIRYEIREITK